jgi:type IV pilus assembly protein PilC
MAVSDFLLHYWWALVVALVILAVFTTKWATSIAGRRFFDKVKMRMWPLAPLFMKMYMARFARTGTTLIGTGVPLIQMLEITGGAVNNVYIEDSIKAAIEKVKSGKSLGDALENDPNFLELVPNMLKIGEQSGSMEQMLGKAADYYEKELDNEIKAIQTTIEPVMMILMGVMAIVIVLAVLLPIYSLAGQADRVV